MIIPFIWEKIDITTQEYEYEMRRLQRASDTGAVGYPGSGREGKNKADAIESPLHSHRFLMYSSKICKLKFGTFRKPRFAPFTASRPDLKNSAFK
jgi:hypothetical protein